MIWAILVVALYFFAIGLFGELGTAWKQGVCKSWMPQLHLLISVALVWLAHWLSK